MTTNRSSQPDERPAPPVRRPLVGSLVLLALTLVIGFAAHEVRGTSFPPPPTTSPTPETPTNAKRGPVRLGVQLDRGSVLQRGDGLVKLELSLAADDEGEGDVPRTATDLVVVLDRSGSMQGHPIAHARAAVHALLDELAPDDRFGLVTYASGAEVAVALQPATPRARAQWRSLVARIGVGGGTNMSAGLDRLPALLGHERTGRAVRVVLLSDGHANEGDATLVGLRARAARAVAGEYVLSTAGVGEGFDEALMTALADAGTGNFYYVQRSDELTGVFAGEFAAARREVASGLTVDLALAPGVQVLDAGGYPLEVDSPHVRFRPGSLFAGQDRRIWVTLRVPTDRVGTVSLVDVQLRYRRDDRREVLSAGAPLEIACVEGEEDFLAELDPDAWSRGVIVESYNAVKAEVAEALQRNEPLAARRAIRSYEARVQEVNAKLAIPAVTEQLEELEGLGSMADAAFAQSPAERNRLSKKLTADSVDGRRVGSKVVVEANLGDEGAK